MFPVDVSVYLTVFTVPHVNIPVWNPVPANCKPGKWHRVLRVSRLPVKLNEMPLPVLLWMCPLFFSPVDPFIEIVPDHLPFFLSAEILKLPGEIITPFCPAAHLYTNSWIFLAWRWVVVDVVFPSFWADVVLPDVPEEESAEVLLALVACTADGT